MQLTVKIRGKKAQYFWSLTCKHNYKNPLKMEELIKIKQNFCNIVGNMSLC